MLDTELDELIEDAAHDIIENSRKSELDLVRECLKLEPYDINWQHDESVYEDKEYLRGAADVFDSKPFEYETKRILQERVEYSAMQAPDDRSKWFAAGAIDSITKLRERLNDHKITLEQEALDLREQNEEGY